MLISDRNYDEKQDIFKVTKYLPTRYLLVTRGKTVTVGKPWQIPH